ncbi:acyl-CoA dehydrogenase family protein [Actinomadura gamaensis]|uniref:Acyl-CoA dehydrogenase family protein n=1 Tax=Actinomadura gamaensis TaxID=1763541 RepID=A0ABV9TZG4_9ACTN
MRRFGTARQRELAEVAEGLAGPIAERAARYDEENRYPFESFAELRKAGLHRVSVPAELGGGGAAPGDLFPMLERLAAADGSTGLTLNMHIAALGLLADAWRASGNERLEWLLREAAADRVLIAGVNSERGVHNPYLDTRTAAERVPGGYRLTGRKSFGTNIEVATHMFSMARRTDEPDGRPMITMFTIPVDTPGVRVHRTWNTLGMRGTQSHDVELDGVFVPDDQVLASYPPGHYGGLARGLHRWAQPTFGAVYTGVALGGMEWTRGFAERDGRADDRFVRDVLAECELLLESSRAVLYRHAAEDEEGHADELPLRELVARAAMVKTVCTGNAIEIMNRLAEVVGGAGLARALPFERMWRDVQAGRVMPFNRRTALELIGAASFGADLPETAEPTDAS